MLNFRSFSQLCVILGGVIVMLQVFWIHIHSLCEYKASVHLFRDEGDSVLEESLEKS